MKLYYRCNNARVFPEHQRANGCVVGTDEGAGGTGQGDSHVAGKHGRDNFTSDPMRFPRCVHHLSILRSKRREAVITSALNRNRPPILLINPSRSSRTE